MTDDALKAIAEKKIKELEKEEAMLKEELKNKQLFNASAWAEYGSELCAGSMIREEKDIYSRIDEVRNKIALLRLVVSGKLDISREERLKNKAIEISNQMSGLLSSLKLVDDELLELRKIKNLLN
ncbi:MAG: hypothetical protein UT29_C0003G0033 [Candidatus Yanofskybacteria bacterium GW2011_GWA1_39_13]|uniref:Uncharacterized protein n=1 Tax=Yanofskybacteria sp. (strain GW2011_GWA1_39_13) TaxID=1619019 RepID=A0A0G0QL08_YANXG|nr:MAG: hypothetical protein UT29_C0003G0033 [Candidatus Yanofskybacteria bacterium GW2011_GWA1_39_13]